MSSCKMLAALTLITSLSVFGADLSGKWSGSSPSDKGVADIYSRPPKI